MKKVCLLLSIVFIFCIYSCGGGTIGTDDNFRRSFNGTILSSNGEPIANVKITDLGSGSETNSDNFGNFSLASRKISGNAELLLNYLDNEEVIIIPNLNEEDANISLTIEINVENGIISLVSFSVAGREDNDSSNGNQDSNNENSNPNPEVTPLKSLIKGTLKFIDGSPAKGATINPIGYRVSDKTGAKGRFRFEIPFEKKNLQLAISFEGAQEVITIRNLPNYAYILNLELEINANQPGIQINNATDFNVLDSNITARD